MNRERIKKEIDSCEKLLIGIGTEWEDQGTGLITEAYEALASLIKEKDYFIVTTNTDGIIGNSSLNQSCIVAPCGNETWRQCSKSCTKDIWEPGEVEDDICPHCGEPLVGNTIKAECYIEEGYLPQWNRYTNWLTGTLHKSLLVLELGVGFETPTVVRWPFEKTVFVNQKAHLVRVHETFPQVTEEIETRATAVKENSVEFIMGL